MVDAPWRQGYDVTDFFNYGLNPGRWKAYAREVQQACAQLRLQEAVVLYNPSLAPLSADLDLPPELKTTLMAKVAPPSPHGTDDLQNFERFCRLSSFLLH